ncbi:MAG TPA: hypothetical protein VGL53_00575, partial [Bryobacteraceae bacterium]
MDAPFELAVEAIVNGDAAALEQILRDDPSLVKARSPSTHHATLLHYIAANGVEQNLQKSPPNAVAIARLLLTVGAAPDATATMYGSPQTTLNMLVSSQPSALAGLQV